jgi:hypothetical protein
MTDPFIIVGVIYLVIAIFIAGFGVGDQMSFRNPEYAFVATVAIFWPIFFLMTIYSRWTS